MTENIASDTLGKDQSSDTGVHPGDDADPGFHPLAGDHADDDGQALDDLFEPSAWGPVESESYALGVEETRKTTRILSRTLPFPSGGSDQPVQLYPADPNRLHVRIIADDAIKIASDKTDLNGAAVLPAGQHWTNDYHTGAIWVVPEGSAGSMNVNIWVVTC